MRLKLMSFNTQHCMNFYTRKIDFDLMADTIRRYDGDIVGLNEIRGAGEDLQEYAAQAQILAQKAGYPYFYFAKAIDVAGGGPYGNALLSRYPIIFAQTIPIPDPEEKTEGEWCETRCVLHVKVDVPGGLDVFVTHFGLYGGEQRNAVRTVTEHLIDSRSILMGDFNVTPDDPVLAPIRARMFDTEVLFPEPRLSFTSASPERKIDYIFTARDLAVLSADIPQIVVSDHCPHIAEIEI